MYYYFKLRNGNPHKIIENESPVNTQIMDMFRELTEEQKNFYLEHPSASVSEVERCELNPPYVPPEPDLDEVKAAALIELDKLSRNALGTKVDVLGFCDAVAGTLYKSEKNLSIYTDDEILSTTEDFLRYGKLCRDKVREVIPTINEATTVSEVENIILDCTTYFSNIVVPIDNLEQHKRDKIREIEVYDISENVNGFFLGDTLLWLDKDTRTGLVNTLNSATLVGRDSINIWFKGMYITLPIGKAKKLLADLEIYATDCYNVTAMHKMQVNNLDSIDAVDEFDVTADYPNRPVFNINN